MDENNNLVVKFKVEFDREEFENELRKSVRKVLKEEAVSYGTTSITLNVQKNTDIEDFIKSMHYKIDGLKG